MIINNGDNDNNDNNNKIWDRGSWLKKRLGSRRSLVSSSVSSTGPFSQGETATVSSREARGGSKKATIAGILVASRSTNKKLSAGGCLQADS